MASPYLMKGFVGTFSKSSKSFYSVRNFATKEAKETKKENVKEFNNVEKPKDPPSKPKDKVTVDKSGKVKIEFGSNPFTLHKLESGPAQTSTTTKEELLGFFKLMTQMRRMEVAADNLYKSKMIRGFLHLYNGQEAIVTGVESVLTKEDHVITAYRNHAHYLGRGGSIKECIAELLMKKAGCASGKGGSMHMYKTESNYHGGNGIVGAQVPVGAGLAFACKYNGNGRVAVSYYGDGAANQGQVFEAYNMASLWKLPAIFICENNKYGMGTSAERSSASVKYYTRGDYVPGLKVDAMNVFAVKESMKFATEFVKKNGPLVMEMETYRYMGHSMSDPGIGYRTRDEINAARAERDPIDKVKFLLVDNGLSTEEELKVIEKEVKAEVDEAVEFAKNAPYPEAMDLYKDVYLPSTGPYFVRTVELQQSLVINP